MTTYKEIFGKPIKVLTGDPAPTPVIYTVTVVNVSGSNYYFIDGVRQLQLELYEGNTYTFDQSDSSNSGHPLRFSITSNGTHSGGSEYTTGVTVSGTPGSSGAKTVIVVASGAPTLYYYCTNHSNMGGIALTPAGPNEYEGQIWYNETTGKFRSIVAGGAWSSATPMSRSPANDALGGCGTPTAGLGFGGYSPPGGTVGLTEEYNGTGWATGGAMNTPEATMGSFGTQTAAVSAGGSPNSAVTEEYNGTAWTTGNAMGTGRGNSSSAGTETSGLVAGGNSPPILGNVEEYNGSTWSEQNNLGTARYQFTGCGAANTAALVFGGSTPGDTGATEEYDGTNWTAGGSLNTARRRLAGSGIQTSALAFGGNTTPPDTTRNLNEEYNGSTWTASPATLATARTALASTKTSSNNSSAVAFAGSNSGGTKFTATEEYNFTANTVVAAAWSSGAALGQVRRKGGGTGTQTAGMIFGGFDAATALGKTEQYNGSSWTEVADLNTARGKLGSATAGSQTAALGFGGSTAEPSNPAIVNNSEEFNGSSWSEGDNLNTARYVIAGAGTQTAGLGFGGYTTGTNRNESEEYNGTSWTEGNNLNTARGNIAGGGTQTAALGATGFIDGGGGDTAVTEEYNGTSWTTVTVCPTTQASAILSGTQTNAIIFAGSPNLTTTFGYDGTNWSTRPSMATGRDRTSGFGTAATAAICAGGDGGTPGDEGIGTVEEFNGSTTALNYKNISSS